MWITLVLAGATFWLARETRRLRIDAAGSAKAAKDSIILSHRPKIIVRNVTATIDPLGPEHSIQGTLQIFNSGNTSANIFTVTKKVWIGNTLPMAFPYDTSGGEKRQVRTFRLLPGKFATEPFSLENKYDFPNDSSDRGTSNFALFRSGNLKVYVMGEIAYQDDLDNQRITRFCRHYQTDKGRFIPVDDPDYECVD
jgi:hypothetical protein